MNNTTLREIVSSPELHVKWINTLSFLENCGAKKIMRAYHPLNVNEVILKHAAEEARHAYFMKRQIAKVDRGACETYSLKSLLAPIETLHYLQQLDVETSRIVKEEMGLSAYDLRYLSYLLVTYAIELRADELYPKYQTALEKSGSPVSVIAIIKEEENHLLEMQKMLQEFDPNWKVLAEKIVAIETDLNDRWCQKIQEQVQQLTGNPELSVN